MLLLLLLSLILLLLLYQWQLFTLSVLFLRVQCDMFSVSVCLWSSFCVFLGVFVICFVFFLCGQTSFTVYVPLRYVIVRGACWFLVLATQMKLRHPFSDVHSHFCFLVFNKYHHKLFFFFFFLLSCPGVCEIKKKLFYHTSVPFFSLLFPMKIQCYGSLTFCP